VSVNDDQRRFVFNDAGAGSIMLPVGFDDTKLEAETAYLPFTTGANAKTLVIGAGAGFDVRMARHAGSSDITAVEINPAMVQVARDQAAYNGGILDAPGVQTVIDDGRHFIERSQKTFDLIFLNLVYSQAAAPSSATLNENFAFTTQAFQAYWRRLGPDGRLGIVAHNGMEGVKLLLTALQALEMEGIPLTQALGHVALVMTNPGDDPEAAPSVLVLRRTAWTTAQSDQFAQQVIARELKALYIPHEFEFTLGVLKNGKMDLGQYLAANPQFELRPTSDDRPFFYQLEPGMPQALIVLAGVGVALLLGLIVVALSRQNSREARAFNGRLILFFTLTGLAYMLAEIALLKRFGLLLGQPTLTLAVVVGGLLLGGALGSLLTQRIRLEQRRSLLTVGLIVTAMLTVFALTSQWLLQFALPLELPVRAIVLLTILTVLGIPMAMFFPNAMHRANAAHSSLIPTFWGVNAIAGGLGSVTATLIALQFGFGPVLLLAAGIYAMVGLLLP
jgi:SAM-dependent methyltransferase